MNSHPPQNPGPPSGTVALPASPTDPLPAKGKPSLRGQIFQCGIVSVAALASYLFLTHFLLQSLQIVGPSMTPTLQNSDRYLLNLCIYRVREPQPSESVVLRDPKDQFCAVKRISACEGDSVRVQGGHVYVNGRELYEPYLQSNVRTFPLGQHGESSWRCGKGQYFVLGDNRGNSDDSRAYGTVPRQNILGTLVR